MPTDSLVCEHPDCTRTDTTDYKRTPADLAALADPEDIEEWAAEPVALCPEHAGERETFMEEAS